jgi:hypothetical protein
VRNKIPHAGEMMLDGGFVGFMKPGHASRATQQRHLILQCPLICTVNVRKGGAHVVHQPDVSRHSISVHRQPMPKVKPGPRSTAGPQANNATETTVPLVCAPFSGHQCCSMMQCYCMRLLNFQIAALHHKKTRTSQESSPGGSFQTKTNLRTGPHDRIIQYNTQNTGILAGAVNE